MADAVCVVTEAEHVEAVKKAKETNPKIKSIVIVGEPQEGCHTFHEMIKADTFGVEFFKGSSVDTLSELALLPFSSGTTGNVMNMNQ
jgi:acyl-coenzyme A synthetase/AMP-(fatty) acid ligase